MNVLVVGASGATGTQLVNLLLDQNYLVKVIVRRKKQLPAPWLTNSRLQIIEASLLNLPKQSLEEHTKNTDTIISCLGHNLTFKGIYGAPRLLVTQAVQRLCHAALQHTREQPLKFLLMNTSGNRNKDLAEKRSFAEEVSIALLRILLPPHLDNEKAANWLRTKIGQEHPAIQWVAIRPDNLINMAEPSAYKVYPSPIRSALFNAGKTSRINVAHFMTSLIGDQKLWQQWQGKMPVIYNS